MAELGQDISGHKPITFEELEDWEGLNFDLIITLSPEAHHKALELTRTLAADVEYWPTHRSDDRPMAAASRSWPPIARSATTLLMRIRKRFAKVGAGRAGRAAAVTLLRSPSHFEDRYRRGGLVNDARHIRDARVLARHASRPQWVVESRIPSDSFRAEFPPNLPPKNRAC